MHTAKLHEQTVHQVVLPESARVHVHVFKALHCDVGHQDLNTVNIRERVKTTLGDAYKIATRVSQERGKKAKQQYDRKVRETVIDVGAGDRVLLRNYGSKGAHKIADIWTEHVYIVIGQPDPSIPVSVSSVRVTKASSKQFTGTICYQSANCRWTSLQCLKRKLHTLTRHRMQSPIPRILYCRQQAVRRGRCMFHHTSGSRESQGYYHAEQSALQKYQRGCAQEIT
ncbi:hypothetical protein DPMN_076123 [Dreissena polymorpha]|uniref:Uncharacterized protein n=1 Tax=Dreissena polymorpha TaxID=45954 RepID=A0A9D3YLT6_DREPO|nr:hypothetical protein DPMN_076123 [Dreissena polymorpha]